MIVKNDFIRIVHVIGNMNLGGAETLLMSLYRNIDREKLQFDFIVHTNDECVFDKEITILGGRIFHCPRYTVKNHRYYVKWWIEFFKNHYEYRIIHGHQRSTASIYLSIAKRFGLITIAHSHSISSRGNIIEKNIKKAIQLKIRNVADWFMACSPEAGEWLFGKEIVKANNFIWMKNAIDIDSYSFDIKIRNEIRNKFNLTSEILFGHVGSFTAEKNHKYLVEVFHCSYMDTHHLYESDTFFFSFKY